MASSIRAMVADGDALGRTRLRTLLTTQRDIELVAESGESGEAVAQLKAHRPDVAFLSTDGVMDGFAVLQQVTPEDLPVLVFVSDDPRFAVQAFEVRAVDYLITPVRSERFVQALDRVRQQLGRWNRRRRAETFPADERPDNHSTRHPGLLAVKSGEKYVMIRTEDIDWVQADDNYVRVRTSAATHLLRKTLSEFGSSVLPSDRFLRIHRSTIVNLTRIKAVDPLFHGELQLTLTDGTRLVCSRRYRSHLAERVLFVS